MSRGIFTHLLLWSVVIAALPLAISGQHNQTGETGGSRPAIDMHYNKFLDTFEAEMAAIPENSDSSDRVAIINSRLPDSFCGTLPSNPVQAWGISDPGMDDAKGMEQAKARALALIALMLNSDLKAVIEDYMKEGAENNHANHSTVYREYLILEAKHAFCLNRVEVMEHHVNNLGEHLVRVAYDPGTGDINSPKTNIEASLEYLKIEFSRSRDFETNDRLALSIRNTVDGRPVEFDYISRKIDDLSDVTSASGGRQLELPPYRYFYSNGGEEAETCHGEVLYFGLWNAYIHELINKVMLQDDVQDALIRSVRDQYKSSMNALNSQVVSKDGYSFRIHTLRANNNELSVMLKQ